MMSNGVGGAAGMAMLALVLTSLVAVSARPNQGLFVDDMRRPVYRGKQRYISNSSSFVRDENLGKTNDSFIISIKLLKTDNVIVNHTKSDNTSSLERSDLNKINNESKSSFKTPHEGGDSESKNKQSNLALVNLLDDDRHSNNNMNKTNRHLENFNVRKNVNRNNTGRENVNLIKRRKIIRIKPTKKIVNSTKTSNKISNIDSQELVQNFISNSIKTLDLDPQKLNTLSNKTKNSTTLSLFQNLADSVAGNHGKRPIIIYPQGHPPNWTENSHDPSYILIEDIVDPALLPKPDKSGNETIEEHLNDLIIQKTSNYTKEHHISNLKEYLYYLTSGSKPSSVIYNYKPDFITPSTVNIKPTKTSLNPSNNFVPIKPIKVNKRPLVTKITTNKIGDILPPPSTTNPVLISFKPSPGDGINLIKNGTNFIHTTEDGNIYVHVSTLSPSTSTLLVKPTFKPEQSVKDHNKYHYVYPYSESSSHNPHTSIRPPPNFNEHPKPETSGWWSDQESASGGSWSKPISVTESWLKPEATTGSWITVTEGEKLERPVHLPPPTSNYPLTEISSPPSLQPIYSFQLPQSGKPSNPIPHPIYVHEPLYIYPPSPNPPVYKPSYVMYPADKVPTSASVTPAPIPVGVTRPSPLADGPSISNIPGVSNPALGPTIILAPFHDEPIPVQPPSRPPPPAIVIIETLSDPPLSDTPDVVPLQDPLPEDCRSVRININNSSISETATSRNCPVNIIINNVPQGSAVDGLPINPVSTVTPLLQPLAGLLPLNGTNILSGNNISPVTQADVDVSTTISPSYTSTSYMDYFYSYLPLFNPLLYPLFFIFLGPIKVLVLGAFILSGFLFPVMIFRAILGLFLG